MKKVFILIILIIFLILFGISWMGWKGYQMSVKGVSISTSQKEYPRGENPKIKIKNNLRKRICFSSCYPYYLEKVNDGLKSYHLRYNDCLFPDVAEVCIEPGQVKAFELLLDEMEIEKTVHRIAVPACIGCALKENFRKDNFFYSNIFIIK